MREKHFPDPGNLGPGKAVLDQYPQVVMVLQFRPMQAEKFFHHSFHVVSFYGFGNFAVYAYGKP